MDISTLFNIVIERKSSDLHLLVGYPPILRIDGNLIELFEFPAFTKESLELMVMGILSQEQKDILHSNKELDFSSEVGKSRFRVNIYFQKGTIAVAFRHLPQTIRSVDELHLPKICHEFAQLRQGFILVTGPTGHGKSTTLAAMINEINITRQSHIITIEDPIEYVYAKGRSIISQREMHSDTHSWNIALKSALREDPDVVMIGEMRDYETIAAALTIAETGHLVFATLHTNSSSQTIDRIVDVFPVDQQSQVRLQLSSLLEGVISQRLVPMTHGGRIPATEILLGTTAVKTAIRDGKTHLIDNIIQTSAEVGMSLLETSLAHLVRKGLVSVEVARSFSLRPQELIRAIEVAN